MKMTCPHCGQHLEVDDDLAGTIISCPACNRNIQVPMRGASTTLGLLSTPRRRAILLATATFLLGLTLGLASQALTHPNRNTSRLSQWRLKRAVLSALNETLSESRYGFRWRFKYTCHITPNRDGSDYRVDIDITFTELVPHTDTVVETTTRDYSFTIDPNDYGEWAASTSIFCGNYDFGRLQVYIKE